LDKQKLAVKATTVQNVYNMLQDLRHIIIFDFRSQEDFKLGHIRKSLNVTPEDYQERLTEAMAGAIGPIEPLIAAGETRTLQAWLQTHVWPLGRTVNGEELVEQVSGDTLGARPFLNHLNGKVEQLLNRT
jgi:hypothetical protein